MANFSTANLVVAQTILSDKYAKPEMRIKPTPALELLLGNANFLTVAIDTLKTRDDRPVEAHLLARTKRNTVAARAFNHTGTIDDSQKVTLQWTTKADNTAISLKLLDMSVLDFNTVLANKMEQCMINIIEDLETAAIAYLLAQRTQYTAGLQAAVWNAVNDAVEISADNKNKFFQVLRHVMTRNKYKGQLDIITDSNLAISAEYLIAQGGGNQVNTAFQFASMNLRESIELSDANYGNGVVLAMPAQSVGALTWIPKQNRQGVGDYNSYLGGYGLIKDPWGMGLTFAVHGYTQRADTSASNGNTQDNLIEFEVSLDTSFNKAPLSGGNSESVIFEAGLVG